MRFPQGIVLNGFMIDVRIIGFGTAPSLFSFSLDLRTTRVYLALEQLALAVVFHWLALLFGSAFET